MPCQVASRSLNQLGLVVELEGRLRIRDRHVVEGVLVLRLRGVEAVRRLVAEDQQERLAAVIALQPVEGQVGDDVRVVARP